MNRITQEAHKRQAIVKFAQQKGKNACEQDVRSESVQCKALVQALRRELAIFKRKIA